MGRREAPLPYTSRLPEHGEGRRRKEESGMKPVLGTKDPARGFWSTRALLHTTAFIFERRENGPQRLVILFSEEIDAGNREMLH